MHHGAENQSQYKLISYDSKKEHIVVYTQYIQEDVIKGKPSRDHDNLQDKGHVTNRNSKLQLELETVTCRPLKTEL